MQSCPVRSEILIYMCSLKTVPSAHDRCRVWSVRYNHSHDQLVLTGSSDSRVILSNMVSISSEPFGHLVDDDDVSDPEEHHTEK